MEVEGAPMEEVKIKQAWWSLRVVFGIVPVVAGLDKFPNLLTNWEQYLSPITQRMLPFDGTHFMRIVGVIEVAVGLMILTKWTRLGAYVAAVWLALIAVNLLSSGHYLDVAARDVALAVAAFALARLEEARAQVRGNVPARSDRSVATPAHI
jgi:uncharacterized membrane protein YphA (DoxX/SURF4 family)